MDEMDETKPNNCCIVWFNCKLGQLNWTKTDRWQIFSKQMDIYLFI